jgi:spore germination cell wall hydrolase CwlJ-like protein
MDLPVSTAARSRPIEEPKVQPNQPFFPSRGGPDDIGLGHLAGAPSIKRQKRGHARRRVLLLVACGCAGALAVYGLATRNGSPHRSEVTVRIPPPQQSVAAIKALPPPNLLKPLTPEQATEENAERPFVARPDTAASRFVLKTDPDNRARALTCLAQAVYYEAAGEGVDGGRAVAQVVLNRMRHPGYPSTICGVVYEGADRPTGCQFSFTCDGSMERIPVPWLWTRSKQIAEQALKGRVFAPVGHATHYHADYVLPFWADSLDKSVQIGRHIFYRLRSTLGDARAFSQHYGGTEPPFREPGATVVIPQTPESQQLANTLINDGAQTAAAIGKPPPPKPATPLIIDSTPSVLLADGQAPPPASHRSKTATDCSTSGDRRQLAPLSATEMRAGVSASTC